MPAIQSRIADASLSVDGLELVAWKACAAAADPDRRAPALLWAGKAGRDVTLSAHQVHGAIGFALETGLHRYYRRAKSDQVWASAVTRACA
jgi:alkylation response protein AidB-like acyl-CoA dehydrogenase